MNHSVLTVPFIRISVFLCFLLGGINFVYAQPSNDECFNATVLELTDIAPCPSTSTAIDNFSFSNIGATPTVPYPTFVGCEPGGATTGPAAEVWFSFTAQALSTSITCSGLDQPSLVLFNGIDCFFLSALACATNPESVTMNAFTQPGQEYFIMVSGGDELDTGDFDLTIASQNDCTPCLLENSFTASPEPINGTYVSGQTVEFCYTVELWDVTSTIEWLHAIEVGFGEGWELNSLSTIPPPSCDGQGIWNWYEQWVGLNTGQIFGPGFAYDSSLGGPLDGDPGNNWGDGAFNCAAIGSTGPPKTFCFTLTAGEFSPDPMENDLGISITVLSDGDSGSWTQVGCNSGTQINFLASIFGCEDVAPSILDQTITSGPDDCDGSFTAIGNGGDTTTTFVYTLLDTNGDTIATNTTGTFTDLCADTYTVIANNDTTNCENSATLSINSCEDTPPSILDQTITSGPDDCDGSFTAVGNGGDTTTTFVYTLIDANGDTIATNTTGTFTDLCADTYTVIANNDTTNCENSATLSIEACEDTPPSILDQTITSGPDDCDGSFTAVGNSGDTTTTFVYTLLDANGDTIATNTTGTFTDLCADTYTVIANNDTTNCENSATLSIEACEDTPPSILDQTATSGPDSCDGSFMAAGDGGNTMDSFTYTLLDTNGDTIATNTTGIFSDLCTGTYTVIANNDATNCENATTVTIELGSVAPIAALIADPLSGTAPISVSFDASGSTDANNDIVEYSWDFGDGNIISTSEPFISYTFDQPGTYVVTLTVIDATGLEDTISVTIEVLEPGGDAMDLELNLSASPATLTQYENIVFNFEVTNTGNLAATDVVVSAAVPSGFVFTAVDQVDGTYSLFFEEWTVGTVLPGETKTLALNLFILTESVSATYFAQIINANPNDVDSTPNNNSGPTPIEDDEAAVVLDDNNIGFAPIPSFLIAPPMGVAPLTIEVDAFNSVDIDGTIEAYNWDFGDGNSGEGMIAYNTYTTPGEYTIELTLTDNDGNTGSLQQTIVVLEDLDASIDLELNLEMTPMDAELYSTVTLSFEVTNTGANVATGVRVATDIPDGFVYSGHNTANGFYDLFFNRWEIAEIAPGETAVLELNIFALTSENTVFYAQIIASNPSDSDSTPNNNPGPNPVEDDEAVITLISAPNANSPAEALLPQTVIEVTNFLDFELFPNPTANHLFFKLITTTDQAISYQISALNGQQILQQEVEIFENESLPIDVSALQNGTYLFSIRVGEQLFNKLFVINK